MGDVGNRVRGSQLLIRGGQPFVDGALGVVGSTFKTLASPLTLFQKLEEIFFGWLWRFLPLSSNDSESFLRLMLDARCHADEISVADGRDARHRLGFFQIDRNQGRI